MAHCPADKLTDIKDVLGEIRSWPEMREASAGIFYLHRVAFFHFQLKDGRRWADVKCGSDWGQSLDISFRPSDKSKKLFLASVRRCYEATFEVLASKRRGRHPAI